MERDARAERVYPRSSAESRKHGVLSHARTGLLVVAHRLEAGEPHHVLGEVEDPPDVSLRFDAESLRWKVDTLPHQPSGMPKASESRERVVDALRAHGKPAI